MNGSALSSGTPLPSPSLPENFRSRSLHEPKASLEPSFDLDERTAARVHTLIAEGALHRACTALTADPLVSPTLAVIDELRLLHPGPTAAHRDMIEKLRPVGPGAVPDVDPDLVRLALATFASTSGAGPGGLRTSHLQDALRYSSGDQTLRLLSEVVLLMMKGEIPEDVRPWVCGASLMALRKPNGSFRPVAVGETLRRLCSKVCVDLMGPQYTLFWNRSRLVCRAVVHTTGRVLVLIDLAAGGRSLGCSHPLPFVGALG